ncbi:carbamoyl phosphate synthase large subunit [Lactobacillus crispatus]|uniref:carbamoyl phosphate synthase large subunit n=1 Tax=Lactobacillus crispatus TaxID=47770 RepID=UPI0018E294E4|nr:carbamoyl phosphate synthase large subunit [Lactobacillus crispatus]MBI1703865.1 carbamoyl phosphate synthase large subunit [Lactobacillus crispatus]
MPLENDLDKVLIIGSGPTLIGSVAEMDLMATEAIDALTEEGIQVVLVNPNPATISTDKKSGVTVYLEPMTLDFLKRILRMEEPDAIMTAYGSTNGLKVAHKLLQDGILEQMGIQLLTLNSRALQMGNQQKKTKLLTKLHIDTGQSWELNQSIQDNLDNALESINDKVTFPVLVTKYNRFVHNEHLQFANPTDLISYFKEEKQNDNFTWKNYRLTEDLSSWEEVIVDVIRDKDGNLAFINFAGSIEAVGINSGDSAVVMPSLTLNNDHIQELRITVRKIMSNLDLIGFASFHFAIKHHGTQIRSKLLTIRPRLTRSSVWAQRIGMYDVGYVVSKVAIGYRLNEITDPLSGLNASIEPTLDAVAIKMPYWSFAESGYNHYLLGSRMQASGEAMGVGRNFETAFLKGLDATINLELGWHAFIKEKEKSTADILNDLAHPDELHLVKLLAAIDQDIPYSELQKVTHLHPVYYQKLLHIVRLGKKLLQEKEQPSRDLLQEAKDYGFFNPLLAKILQKSVTEVRSLINKIDLQPSYLKIDGSAGIYKPNVCAYYSAYDVQNEAQALNAEKKILILGMLPLQVSVTSEFDYMIAHAADTLHKYGYVTVLLSNNDESISSRYKNIDRVYFDSITVENILTVAKRENISDVLVQFSGKRISALSKELEKCGLHVIGQKANDDPRDKITTLLDQQFTTLKRVPALNKTTDTDQIFAFASKYGFPLLIGGMNKENKQKSAVVYDVPAIEKYLAENQLDQITISRFIEGHKYEVTAISDGTNVTLPGIIEHLEQTGSHASDSIAVIQPQNLTEEQQKKIEQESIKLIKQLKTKGIFNLHYLFVDNDLYLLQIKPYAGHNVAFLSKSLDKDITTCATEALIGKNLAELGYPNGLWQNSDFIHIKMPVFSFLNYSSGNTFDSNMKSSGSVMGRDTQLAKALYKGYEASDLHIPSYGTIFISVRDEDKNRVTQLARRFDRLGFKLIATEGTANMFAEAGITTGVVEKVHKDPRNLLDKIRQHKIVMVVNITNLSDAASEDASRIRDEALNTHIPVFSSIETAELILDVLESLALTTQPI